MRGLLAFIVSLFLLQSVAGAQVITKRMPAAETDPIYSAWDKDYSDLSNKPDLSIYLTTETDPVWLSEKSSYATTASLADYVPYTGASSGVNLGAYGITIGGNALIGTTTPDANGSKVTISDADRSLGGAVQSTAFQVLGSASDGVNRLAHFDNNQSTSRSEVTFSNSGTSAWQDNFVSFMLHGGSFALGNIYLPDIDGKYSDAGWAYLLGQGTSQSGLGFLTYNANPIAFGTNNATRMYIGGSTGNVLIGKTTDTGERLQVFGIPATLGDTVAKFESDSSNSFTDFMVKNSNPNTTEAQAQARIRMQVADDSVQGVLFGKTTFSGPYGGFAYFWNTENSDFAFATNNSEKMRLTASGNLLIGGSTDYGYKLSLAGNMYLPNSGATAVSASDLSVPSSYLGNQGFTSGWGGNGFNFVYGNSVAQAFSLVIGGDGAGYFGNPDSATIYMRVGSDNIQLEPTSGNVLIGTTSDDATNKLQVNGSIVATNLSGSNTGDQDLSSYLTKATDKMSKSFVLSNPTSSMDLPLIRIPDASTITSVSVLCVDGTNIVGNMWEYDENGANGATVGTDITAVAGTNNTQTSFTNPTIGEGHYLGWKTTSVSGSVTRAIVTYEYTRD